MSRPETRASRLPLAERPLVAAPMAGGPTTVALARAVGAAGGFAFLAGGYKNPDALRAEIEELSLDGRDFGVNLFVPDRSTVDPDAFRRYRGQLRDEADRYGLDLPATPAVEEDGWDDLLALLQRVPVPVVSLTFGLPPRHDIAALQRAGSRLLATVTTADEARAAKEAGVDGLVVQGPAAGGHSGTHDPARDPRDIGGTDTVDVVRQVRGMVDLPVVAAGGVDGPDAVRRLLQAGAIAVAVGTMFLLADEAGTNDAHRRALADPRFSETVVTRAFTGRPARALRNGFVDRHSRDAPAGYPAIHHLTSPLRQAAAAAGDTDLMHLWAGTGYRHAVPAPAARIVRSLTDEL